MFDFIWPFYKNPCHFAYIKLNTLYMPLTFLKFILITSARRNHSLTEKGFVHLASQFCSVVCNAFCYSMHGEGLSS